MQYVGIWEAIYPRRIIIHTYFTPNIILFGNAMRSPQLMLHCCVLCAVQHQTVDGHWSFKPKVHEDFTNMEKAPYPYHGLTSVYHSVLKDSDMLKR